MIMRRSSLVSALLVAVLAPAWSSEPAAAEPARENLLAAFAAEAKAADPAFAGFDAARGRAFFLARPGGGKPETPSCTTCHAAEPTSPGRTRAGKTIDPIAVSRTPARFTDPEKVAKWFRRNCNSVLGRACTAREKGDFITFMATR